MEPQATWEGGSQQRTLLLHPSSNHSKDRHLRRGWAPGLLNYFPLHTIRQSVEGPVGAGLGGGSGAVILSPPAPPGFETQGASPGRRTDNTQRGGARRFLGSELSGWSFSSWESEIPSSARALEKHRKCFRALQREVDLQIKVARTPGAQPTQAGY